MSRQAVRQSFNRAAASYDAAATLQRRVCELLLTELPDAAPTAILDAGCGTGYGLGLLAGRWPRAHVIAADFASAMRPRSIRSEPRPSCASRLSFCNRTARS